MNIEQTDFDRFAPRARHRKELVEAFNRYFPQFHLTTPARICHFLAQAAHESGGFYFLRELWGPTPQQERYEGREDLGNRHSGDGYRYRGRGIFQLTGRSNYRKYGELLGLPLEDDPELAENPEHAVHIACVYWQQHSLNSHADNNDLLTITRKINGGTTGLKDREGWLRQARKYFEGD